MRLFTDPELRERLHVFEDRYHAGELLAKRMKKSYAEEPGAILLAIPSGGVPVAFVLAKRLRLPMDLWVVRKLHFPWNREAGFGAISWDGTVILNEQLVSSTGLEEKVIQEVIEGEREDIKAKLRELRKNKPPPELEGKVAILVDDGLASGYSMLVAAKSVRKRAPRRVVVAVPTASLGAIELLKPHIDELYCPNVRSGPIFAVADAYVNWYDVSEEEVLELLQRLGL